MLITLAFAVTGSELHAQDDTGRPAVEVQETIEDVLADPEFRHLHIREPIELDEYDVPQWLKDFLRWLFQSDSDSQPAGDWGWGFNFTEFLLFGLVTLIVVMLVALLINAVRNPRDAVESSPFSKADDEEAINPTRPPGDIASMEYERRAREAAGNGDYRTAIRELVLGSMSWTERAGLIRYRRGLTNRDYVRAIWRQLSRRESLMVIVAAFERIFYGRRFADADTFEACLEEFHKSFASETADAHPAN